MFKDCRLNAFKCKKTMKGLLHELITDKETVYFYREKQRYCSLYSLQIGNNKFLLNFTLLTLKRATSVKISFY